MEGLNVFGSSNDRCEPNNTGPYLSTRCGFKTGMVLINRIGVARLDLLQLSPFLLGQPITFLIRGGLSPELEHEILSSAGWFCLWVGRQLHSWAWFVMKWLAVAGVQEDARELPWHYLIEPIGILAVQGPVFNQGNSNPTELPEFGNLGSVAGQLVDAGAQVYKRE
jgi:hypothetical protein